MSLELNRAEIKELVGKRVTINGERHRVEKVLISKRTLTTDKGKTISVDDLYRKGRGFFADIDEPKSKRKAKEDAPVSRRKKKVEEPVTGRGRTRRKAKDVEEAPVSRRKKKVEEEAPVSRNRKAKRIQRDTTLDMDDYTPKKVKTIKVPSFDQKIADKIATLMTEKGIEFIKENLGFDLSLIATSATYNNTINTVTITLGKTGMSDKEIIEIRNKDAYIDDVSSEDDLDDLEEFEPEDEELEDEDEELEDESEVESDDIEDDEEDEDLTEDDEEDEDLTEDEEDEDDGEEESEVDVSSLVEAVLEVAPDLNEDKVQTYIENYLASDEIEEHFGDEMCPGASYLSEKGKSLEFLLVGLDSDTNMVRLLNLKTLKFRSKSIEDVVHMELLDK